MAHSMQMLALLVEGFGNKISAILIGARTDSQDMNVSHKLKNGKGTKLARVEDDSVFLLSFEKHY